MEDGQLKSANESPATPINDDGVPGSAGQSPVTLTVSNVAVSSQPLLREQTAKPTISVLFIVMLRAFSTVQFVPSAETEPVKIFPVRFNFNHCGGVLLATLVVPVPVPFPPVPVR